MGSFILIARPSLTDELTKVMNKFREEGDSKTDTLLRILEAADVAYDKKHGTGSIRESLNEVGKVLDDRMKAIDEKLDGKIKSEPKEKEEQITFIQPQETDSDVRKRMIRKYSQAFDGYLNDKNLMRMIGVDATVYYELKNEVRNEYKN